MRKMNHFYYLIFQMFKIYFNITPSSTPRFSKESTLNFLVKANVFYCSLKNFISVKFSNYLFLTFLLCSVLHSVHLILCVDNIYCVRVKTTLFPADRVAVSKDIVTI
jgi:hypothetical protein